MRIVFFGTPDFAAAFLERLHTAPGFEVATVVTQPDEPVGRKKTLTPPPVKTIAQSKNIPVLQPDKLKDPAFGQTLAAYAADAFVVVAYGRIIPQQLLDIPRLGCINVHPSLLPHYRGPSPIQTAILDGVATTGVTIMKLDAGMDHGPLLAQAELPLSPTDTPETVYPRVVEVGAPLLIDALIRYSAGTLEPQEQQHENATTCRLFTREDGQINWQDSAEVLERKIRAFTPWPGTQTMWNRNGTPMIIKVLTAVPASFSLPAATVTVREGRLYVGTGGAALELLELQPAAGKRMTAKAFLAGYRDIDGAVLQ